MSSDTQTDLDRLRQNRMMKRLIDALDDSTDIGHYGRLTFAMVAVYVMDAGDVTELLSNDHDFPREEAEVMVKQVKSKGYSPPTPEKIRAWDQQQDFQILPAEFDPADDANVYRDLDFPPEVYDGIREYHVEND